MNNNLIKLLFLTLLLITLLATSVYAQDSTNVLPLHTGKSYILDFPVKVTRVVGGDPSAMELNLFKKDTTNAEAPGYQLLIAPIAEKNTNIIVWSEIGLYVFDVIIDNSSPYTAETIINVPKNNKKFTIPIMESSQFKGQTVNTNLEEKNKLTIAKNTGDIIDAEDSSDNESSSNQNEQTSDQQQDFVLDKPPAPLNDTNKDIKKESVTLKPQIPVNNSKVDIKKENISENIQKTEPENIEITLKPQIATNFNVEHSLDSKAEKLYSGKLFVDNEGLKLEINSVNKVDNSLVIHISLENTSTDCKYLLWDLTKVANDAGEKFNVRNQNLPPGIVYPGKVIKGEIIAYPKNDSQKLPSSGKISVALLGTQGETLVKTEIPLQNAL